MSAACELAVALVVACVTPPDIPSNPVIVKRSCALRFSQAERDAAKECAGQNGIRWRLNRRR